MKQQKESGGISIANIITVVGVIVFGVLTYLGQLYLNEGDQTSSLLWAIGLTVITGALAVGLVALKGAKVDAKLMFIVQIVLLVVYAGFAFLSSRGALKFLDVQGDKENLQSVALSDIAKINSIFVYYEEAENDFANLTETSFDNALAYRNGCDRNVLNMLETLNVRNKEEKDGYMIRQKNHILGDTTYFKTKIQFQDSIITPCKNAVRSWDVLKVPTLTKQLKYASRRAKIIVDSYSERATLPVFDTKTVQTVDPQTHQRTTKLVTTLKDRTQTFSANEPLLEFGNMVKTSPKVTISGIIILVLLHLMILLSYIVASSNGISYGRSSKKKNTDSGIDL